MSDTLERMLRIALMNQVDIMSALEELLGPEPLSEDDHATRAAIRANIGEALEQTIDTLKSLKGQSPAGLLSS